MTVAPREHPIQLALHDDLSRSRLTVFFRPLLAIPHLVWLLGWSVAAVVTAVCAWVAALVTGKVPSGLHRFLAAYVRYATHVSAFVYLVGREFPGFTGSAGSYGVDVEIPGPEEQRRETTGPRLFLAIPALLLAGALGWVALLAAFLGWWYALVTGRLPERLRNLGASCLRYSAQTSAYLLLLTDRYPSIPALLERSPAEESGEPEPPATEPQPAPRRVEVAALAGGGLVLLAAALVVAIGVVGVRSLGEAAPSRGVLHVVAPPEGCWSIALGHTEADLGAKGIESGCGPKGVDVDLEGGLEAQFSKQPPGATWDLGARLEVGGEVVREVTPGRHWGLRIRYGEDVAEKTIEVRVDALDGGCWSATIETQVREGCGSWTFQLEVEGSANMIFERQEPGTWAFGLALVADGRVVQTVGPATDEDAWLTAVYAVPREVE